MARPQNLRRIERHRADHRPADNGAKEPPGNGRLERPFDQRRRPHRAHPDRRGDKAEPDQRAVVGQSSARRRRGALMSYGEPIIALVVSDAASVAAKTGIALASE